MLDSLEERAEQARIGQLGPVEFLAILLDDELARREQAAQARRLRLAQFDQVKTLGAVRLRRRASTGSAFGAGDGHLPVYRREA